MPVRALQTAAVSAVWVTGIVWLANLPPNQRRRALQWTVAGATISAAVSVLQAAGLPLMTVQASDYGNRLHLAGLAGNPSDLAMTACLLLALVVSCIHHSTPKWHGWICPCILTVAILVSQSLTGYVALALIVVTWSLRRGSRRTAWRAAGCVVILAVVVLVVGPTERFEVKLRRLKEGSWYSLLSARSDGLTAAAQMIRSQPVLGVGAGHFGHAYYSARLTWLESRDEVGKRGEIASHFAWTHCDPLQLIAEMGVLGILWLTLTCTACVVGRRRGDPTLAIAGAAFLPFALLHYPTHVAVGLVPVSLITANLIAATDVPAVSLPARPGIRATMTIICVVTALAIGAWQIRSVVLNLWQGRMETLLRICQGADESQRSRLAAVIESEAQERIDRNPSAAPWALRVVGRARLAKGDPAGSEAIFRTAHELWPHEEAEFGIGLAVAAQGRREEALHHLSRVCRTNPSVAQLIPDPDLQQEILELNRVRRQRH
jgi:hypothetical protein